MTFSERLADLIYDRAVSRYKIAQDTKITEATLSNYCNGKVRPSPSIVKQLSDYFQVDYDWLLTGGTLDGRVVVSIASDNADSEYGNKKMTKANIKQMLTLYERQIAEKDKLINDLLRIIENKLDVLLTKAK